MEKRAIIIGAGPAGLTAAYELLKKSEIKPWIFEADAGCGGLSRTVNYKGNRIDIGGHRFFSKLKPILKWWFRILPLEMSLNTGPAGPGALEKELLAIAGEDRVSPGSDRAEAVMQVRDRLSRIFFMKKFFDYPLSLKMQTLKGLGWGQVAPITGSYLWARAFPIKPEKNLEELFINRFGRRFYQMFFREYTEKVWGVSCREIGTGWGEQRIKGLSLSRALFHALKSLFGLKIELLKTDSETSLIEQFLYPKYGPGQLWEAVAKIVEGQGGKIVYRHRVVGVQAEGDRILAVRVRDEESGRIIRVEGDYFFSSMPVCDLIRAWDGKAPREVQEVSDRLAYMDFITVGLLFKQLRVKGKNRRESPAGLIPDNWIYVQEPRIKMGRIQIFNNWSPALVRDPDTVWLGAEYFYREDDPEWGKSDGEIIELAIRELTQMGLADPEDYLDGVVVRMKKTYPGYFGSYDRFSLVRDFTDGFHNLFLIGRNGMHRYNNQDHSMLTAMTAVGNILAGRTDKANIWQVNTEPEYLENKVTFVENLTGVYKQDDFV